MPFIKSKSSGYLLKKRVEIGLEMGEAAPSDVYIDLREPTEQEKVDLNEAYGNASAADRLKALYKLFATLMVDHNFYETEDAKMQPAAIMELLKDKSFALEKIIIEYVNWVKDPFPKPSASK